MMHARQRTPVERAKHCAKQHESETLLATRRRILGYLACYPLLRSSDLAAALNRTTPVHPLLPPDASNMARHLRVLARAGLVEAVRHTGVKAALWRLTPRGKEVVAAMAEKPISEANAKAFWLTSQQQVDRPGNVQHMRRLARLVLVQDIALGLCIHAPDGFAAADRGRRPGVAWHWMRDWQCRFVWRHRAITVRADAVLLWQRAPGQHAGLVELADASDAASASATLAVWHCAFVLVERVQETQTSIRRLVERLVQYRESSCRLPVYGEFPPVLIVVRHAHHRGWWKEAVRSVAERERVSPLTGAIARLPEEQAGCGDPWRLAWQSLADESRIALAAILLPLRREAWPAGLSAHLHAATALMQRLLTATPTAAGMLKWAASSQLSRSHARIHRVPGKHDLPGPRHERILTLLAQHPLLTLAELAALLDLKASSAERYLRDLRRAGFIQVSARDDSQGNASRWWLTAEGVKYTASVDGHAAIHRAVHAPTAPANKPHNPAPQDFVTPVTPLHPEHLWGVYGFMAALHQTASAHQARVLWWETGAACERSYPWHNAQRNLRPDAEFELSCTVDGSVRHLRYWLEYDRGTMHRHDLCAKMGAYADYLRSREWMTSGSGMAALPRVLFVVPDSEQERRVAEACASQLAGYPLHVLVTTAGHVAAGSPYGPIWRQVYPPSKLSQEVQARTMLWM
jgi:DNA-binding MarR family transcriptional regulator